MPSREGLVCKPLKRDCLIYCVKLSQAIYSWSKMGCLCMLRIVACRNNFVLVPGVFIKRLRSGNPDLTPLPLRGTAEGRQPVDLLGD